MQNCGQFSTEDENKFIYTTIHAKFVELVEGLLSKNLHEIGISDDQFVAAVASGSNSADQIQRVIFGQILAVDDFLTFKKLMTSRNAELEAESIKMLSTYSPSDEAEAQLQLELALAISQSEASSEAAKISKAKFSEDDLAVALRLSMLDTEKQHSEYEREQAEFEHVIAMSLAAEAERLRMREMMEEIEKEEAAAAAAAAVQTKQAPVAADAPKAAAAIPIVHGVPIVFGEPLPKQLMAAASSSSSAAAAPRSALPPIGVSSSSSFSSSSKLGGLPPLSALGRAPAMPLAAEKALHEENVRRAESAFAANQATLREAKASTGATTTLDPEELARRKEFLTRQREMLLKKKREQREGELEKFEAARASLEAGAAAAAAATASSSSSSTPAAAASSAPRVLSESEELQRKKDAMQGALVAHLKSVHHDVELKRAATLASSASTSAATSVRDQLAEMEQLRRAKSSGMQAEQEQYKQQEAERKRILQQMHANMSK